MPVVSVLVNGANPVSGAWTAGAFEVAFESDLQKLRRFSIVLVGWISSDAWGLGLTLTECDFQRLARFCCFEVGL